MAEAKITWTVRVDEEMNDKLEQLAEKMNVPKNTLIVDALEVKLKKMERSKK